MKEEVWKDIEGYEGLYQVSNFGRVRSLDRNVTNKGVYGDKSTYFTKGKLLKPSEKQGYLRVVLSKNNERCTCSVHRLVAETFIPNPLNLPCVNHKDENKSNNHVDNLEWCSVGYNNTYGTKIENTKRKLSKTVYQYDLSGNFIKEWIGASYASEALSINKRQICSVCNNKRKTAGGFIWKYKENG